MCQMPAAAWKHLEPPVASGSGPVLPSGWQWGAGWGSAGEGEPDPACVPRCPSQTCGEALCSIIGTVEGCAINMENE